MSIARLLPLAAMRSLPLGRGGEGRRTVALFFVPVIVIIHYLGGADGNAELGAVAFGTPYCVLGFLAFLGGRTGGPRSRSSRARRWC